MDLPVELAWFGVSTFRLRIGGTVVFLDAYLDRVSAAPPNGLGTADVDEAQAILIGHSHFDHLYGAQAISDRTGALIVGSHETVRLMAAAGVPSERRLPVAPGDLVELGPDVRARVLPSLHSCVWAGATPREGESQIPLRERQRRLTESNSRRYGSAGAEILEHIAAASVYGRSASSRAEERPRGDGGALGYLIETPAGRVYWADTSGYFTGIVHDLRPDVAILAAAGRGNVDGEPAPQALPEFLATQIELMRPGQVVLCHHDDWMPPVTRPGDVGAIRAAVADRTPDIDVHSLSYGEILRLGA
jgi:L-ascorbate metabolism protein UlaG (beta-lactamase superfamily)